MIHNLDHKAALSSLLARLKKLAHNVATIAFGIGGALMVVGIILVMRIAGRDMHKS